MRFQTGIVILISILLATTASAAPHRTAAARRAATLERDARALVERHFTALTAGDEAELAAIWGATATVTSTPDGEAARVVPIADAIPIWLAAREGFYGSIKKVRTEKEGVVIYAIVKWNGVAYADRLVVRRDADRVLRIVAKTTTPLARETTGHVGYGG